MLAPNSLMVGGLRGHPSVAPTASRMVLSSRVYGETVHAAAAESGVALVELIEEAECVTRAPHSSAPFPALARALADPASALARLGADGAKSTGPSRQSALQLTAVQLY